MNRLSIYSFLLIFLYSIQASGQYKTEMTVAQDGSGDFKTIQQAVNATRDLGERQVLIHIKNGIYHEKISVPSWKTRISLIGESRDKTVITNSDYSGKSLDGTNDKFSTHNSYTLLVEGNDFVAENLSIENNAGRVGQAVALHVEGDRCVIRNCRILGNQDTLYATREGSRQFYQDCEITGTTDFIFGSATAVFFHCTIKSLANSFITAAATTPRQAYGFVFIDCQLTADSLVKKVYLGRPWRPYARTVYLNCNMGDHILPGGWDPWKGDLMFPDKEKTAYYAEYNCFGKGALSNNRVTWSKQLSPEEAKHYTTRHILAGNDQWAPIGFSGRK